MGTNRWRISLAASVALHAAAIGGLLQFVAVREPPAPAIPIVVELIAPPKPEPPAAIEPPTPRPVARRAPAAPKPQTPPTPPLLSTESAGPATGWVAPAAKHEPAPVAVAPPAPVPPQVVSPSFDAAYLKNPAPAYPPMSRRRGEQGTVLLRVYVNAEGAAERVAIRTSSGYERLDQAAHDVVHRWRFVPARQGDQAVAAWVLVPVTFTLD